MEEEKRTPDQWTEYFGQEKQPITKADYIAATQARLLGVLVEVMQTMHHLEGMQGSHDNFMARYAQILGIEYIPSPVVQEALREHALKILERAREEKILELPTR